MFDDDGEQSPEERRAEERIPKTRDLAAEITPTAAEDDDDLLGGDLLEADLLDRHDEVADVDVDGETATAFWAAVIYVNVGLMLVSVGPMLAFFRGRTQVGGLLVVLGSFALYRAYTVYGSYSAPESESASEEGSGTVDDESGIEDDEPETEDDEPETEEFED